MKKLRRIRSVAMLGGGCASMALSAMLWMWILIPVPRGPFPPSKPWIRNPGIPQDCNSGAPPVYIGWL